MKTTLLTFFITIFLFSCQTNDEVLDHLTGKGKVTFKAKKREKESIVLTNARTAETKADELPTNQIDLYKANGDIVFLEKNIDDLGEVELEPGEYKAKLIFYDLRDDYYGKTAAEGEQTFTVEAGKTQEIEIMMYYYRIEIQIMSNNMAGAKAAFGPVGFEPAAEDFQVMPVIADVYADAPLDIVVDFEGEQKRYTANLTDQYNYYINIVKNEDEEPQAPETGSASFTYYPLEKGYETISFEW